MLKIKKYIYIKCKINLLNIIHNNKNINKILIFLNNKK